jgi:alcohol dehydrogenase
MNVSDCSAEHSLGQAIGGLTHAPHGLTIGLVLAETLDRERAFVAPQLERVATAMGEPEDGTSDGSRAVRAVKRLLKNLDFPVLSDLDLNEADLDTLTELALADYFITMAPEPWTTGEVRACFAGALGLKSR